MALNPDPQQQQRHDDKLAAMRYLLEAELQLERGREIAERLMAKWSEPGAPETDDE